MIDAFVAQTFGTIDDITAVVAAVQQDNVRSWRALEKAGFARAWAGQIASTDPTAIAGRDLSTSGRVPPK